MPMRRLAVVHHRHQDWVPALRGAEPRLDIRGWHPREALGADAAWLSETEALFTWKFPDGFLARMPRLQWIQNAGAGVDHLVAHPEIPEHVAITRADGHFGTWMARYVCAHLLFEAQRLAPCAAAQVETRWDPKLQPEDLGGALALIVGYGRIGRRIGEALRSLGLTVQGFVRTPRPDPDVPLSDLGALPEALPRARLLVLCAPLTEATRGLVNARLLARGHDRLTLVNVGRGALVVTQDLLEALDHDRLGRAVLDVFETEPLPPTSPLWHHPKVVVTPHHSGPSTPKDLIPDILENLRAYAEGRPIQGAVDRRRGY